MSKDLFLISSCSKCGSISDLYGSNCKHMTLCFNCGKTMAENKAKCFDCGATLTRLIREYSVRASSGNNDKDYFIGRFLTVLPDFSKKKTADNKWSLHKKGLQSRQVTDALRAKNTNRSWLLEDETGQSQYQGHLEGAQSATYYLLVMERKKRELVAIPTGSWYNFNKVAQYKQLTLEEAEEKIKNRRRTAEGFGRWMMKGEGFDHKGNNVGGGKKRKQNSEDDEYHSSDKGEEDEEEEAARKNRLELHKQAVDDDEEGAWGGDYDQDDDDIEKGDDWEHEEAFSDDDEAVGVDPEVREDWAREVPAPPEIKQDDDDENENDEEGEGLSIFGKELKELLGRASGSNESVDDEDDQNMADEVGSPLMIASKQKGAPKEEAADNSLLKPAATGTPRGDSKGKRKLNEETIASNRPPTKKLITENETKPSVKDEHGSALKTNAPPKGALPAPSKVGSSTMASGSVTEEGIRAVLMQNARVTTKDLSHKFKGRLRSSEDKNAFLDILKRISKFKKTADGSTYLVLRDG